MARQRLDLAWQVKAALTVDPRVAPCADAIAVDVDDGVVTLRGMVERLAERGAAEVVARKLPDVSGVNNLLLVGPRNRTDAEVEKAVFDAFVEDPHIDERLIQVRADDGVVTLEGEVENLTLKRLAGGIAWWMRGVRGVVNKLQTREETTPELESNGDLLAAAIKGLYDKDPLVDAVEVEVIVLDGVATLVGTVCSEIERDAAEDDAWATLGVKDVRNDLEIAPAATPAQLSDYQP